MSKKALLFIVNGTEETEAITTVDLLRRANFNVKIAGDNEIITCSRGVKIIPDILIENIIEEDEFDVLIIPGGGNGVYNLSNNLNVIKLLKHHNKIGTLIAAICAAPSLLIDLGIINDFDVFTGFPSLKDEYPNHKYADEEVLVNKNIITSKALGTTIPFSLKIIEILTNKENSIKISDEICWNNR